MSPRSGVRPRWLVPVVIVVVSIMVGGGLLARELYRLPDAPPDAVLAPSTATHPPAQLQPGPGNVALTPDAAAHPHHDEVRAVLQAYFDAINTRDYDLWKTAVTRERQQSKPRSTWLADYGTTRDGSILVYRIDAVSATDLNVLVGFTSTQDPEDAPPELPQPCVQWRLVLPLTLESSSWRVAAARGSTTPELSAC